MAAAAVVKLAVEEALVATLKQLTHHLHLERIPLLLVQEVLAA